MKNRTVCIIDDDPIFVYGTKVLLNYNSSFCSNIIVHEDGEEALESITALLKAKQKLPDVIFLDLNMPIMDGWEFLDRFVQLSLEEKPRIYIVSSSIDPSDLEKAKGYGIVNNFVSKPFSDAKLLKLFNNIDIEDAL
tara:strand:- start:274 stop:684 length:411 start_codon:yes stop_codon:yes gene_type:complete